ncbi:MAG: DUF1428 domain-containing protein [Pseudomonadota bacterium]
MVYVDGFVAAVPSDERDAFLAHARIAADIFKERGALEIRECWGNDVPHGTLTSFPKAVQCEAGETVVFSWVVWPSKDVRDAGWAALMEDPRMSEEANPMPFDGKRMIFGGFESVLEA